MEFEHLLQNSLFSYTFWFSANARSLSGTLHSRAGVPKQDYITAEQGVSEKDKNTLTSICIEDHVHSHKVSAVIRN